MSKGNQTREAILAEAVDLSSVVGLSGLTIGGLARHSGLSKSGLFAHFGSKETLQVAILESGVRRFVAQVVQPALAEPRGLARVRTLFDNWLDWSAGGGPPGGCLFITASIEFDDRQPGPVRDYLVTNQTDWLDLLARTARFAIEVGDFRPDLDSSQFAHEFNSIFLGYQQSNRLLRDPEARARAVRAFDRLLEDAKHARAPA